MPSSAGLGRVLNVVPTASGVGIKLTNAVAVTFVCVDAGVGDQVATITQRDSSGALSEIAMPSGTLYHPYVGPDTGGTWTAHAEPATNVLTSTGGATNDTIVFTVRADTLSDGYDTVEVTVDGGTCVAIIHDLLSQRKPSNLPSSIL